MEINIITGVLFAISILSTIIAIYATTQYKKKNENENENKLALEEQIAKYNEVSKNNEIDSLLLEEQIIKHNEDLLKLKDESKILQKKNQLDKIEQEKILSQYHKDLEIKELELQSLIQLEKESETNNLLLEEQIIKHNKDLLKLKDESKILQKKNQLDKIEQEKILSQYHKDLEIKKLKLQSLIELEKESETLNKSVITLKSELEKYKNNILEINDIKNELTNEINDIKKDIQLYSQVHNLIAVGFFEEPIYLFETSQRFKEEILLIRQEQKELIQTGQAIAIPEEIAFIDKAGDAKKAIKGQSKIMLKAFNIETDLLISSLKPSNFANTLEKIEKLANEIEKSALSLSCAFTEEYVKLKYNECALQYQFKLKQEYEKEEQKAIKEQIREENQAIREYEIALAKAEKEEKMYRLALEQARKELDVVDDATKNKLIARISFLELNLEEALANEERAKSMAQQTKRGHVYVISNIGSFGENIYKIGMTRRLEPLDRVKELGNASVPFIFDVHAMIFSDDAPRLERELHKKFTHKRLNAVNHRKEFFNVSLIEIQEAINNIIDIKIDFKMTAIAEDYYESIKLRDVLKV